MGRLSGKKVAFIVSHEFEDVELLYPVLRLSEEGAGVVIGICTEPPLSTRPAGIRGVVTGRFGTTVPLLVMEEGRRHRTCDYKELRAEDFDALIIPGGFSPDFLRINSHVINLVREFHRQGKVLAAICHGPQVLISAGLLRGKRATCYAAVRDDLINAGAEFVDEPAVRDGNIVTAQVPDTLPEFCRAIVEALTA